MMVAKRNNVPNEALVDDIICADEEVPMKWSNEYTKCRSDRRIVTELVLIGPYTAIYNVKLLHEFAHAKVCRDRHKSTVAKSWNTKMVA